MKKNVWHKISWPVFIVGFLFALTMPTLITACVLFFAVLVVAICFIQMKKINKMFAEPYKKPYEKMQEGE
ncbi:MAG: hypothetical protein A2998_01225 [Candidatus Staskawiczbacteria bacterium RIFCSPLOWO2_01_FULL_37_25b]|uniref:Uncharacterized protein n=2 Tax=Candidatus Staskawicziibacteriota TaxID=1817916 RepID=A0A1G2HMG9_9BACT|nr:MAG: hypothetical protein A2812_01935 [Candidatus Staskawiczbacteria bacterium RIFCSPHIGHO2_01_FULL_36_16]OGZ72988.1 MAG: hypothetical protein A2998_01225 [Candidatus Staskawiczbacteria bacterium RIFCSPLOWO2_01_FULL_37_25b]